VSGVCTPLVRAELRAVAVNGELTAGTAIEVQPPGNRCTGVTRLGGWSTAPAGGVVTGERLWGRLARASSKVAAVVAGSPDFGRPLIGAGPSKASAGSMVCPKGRPEAAIDAVGAVKTMDAEGMAVRVCGRRWPALHGRRARSSSSPSSRSSALSSRSWSRL
jgi:hypothetical protein